MQALGLTRQDAEFAQKAFNYLNDSYRTIIHILYQPNIIACAIIHMTSKSLGIGLPSSPPWYAVFDSELADIILIEEMILDLYSYPTARGFPEILKP